MTDMADGVVLQAGGNGHELLRTCSTLSTLLCGSQGKDGSWQVAFLFYAHASGLGTKPTHGREDSRVLYVAPAAQTKLAPHLCQSWPQIAAQHKLLLTASSGVACPKCKFGAAQLRRVIEHHY